VSELRRSVDWAAVRRQLGAGAVGEALRRAVPTERLYVFRHGSQEANSHVHWHLAALPPRVPFEKRQLVALGADPLDLKESELEQLARRIRAELKS
jgi:hypothetical protein